MNDEGEVMFAFNYKAETFDPLLNMITNDGPG